MPFRKTRRKRQKAGAGETLRYSTHDLRNHINEIDEELLSAEQIKLNSALIETNNKLHSKGDVVIRLIHEEKRLMERLSQINKEYRDADVWELIANKRAWTENLGLINANIGHNADTLHGADMASTFVLQSPSSYIDTTQGVDNEYAPEIAAHQAQIDEDNKYAHKIQEEEDRLLAQRLQNWSWSGGKKTRKGRKRRRRRKTRRYNKKY